MKGFIFWITFILFSVNKLIFANICFLKHTNVSQIFATINASKTKDDIIKAHRDCMDLHGVGHVTLESYKQGTVSEADKEKSYCASKCIIEKMEIYSEIEGFNIDRIIDQMKSESHLPSNENDAREFMTNCIEEFKNEENICKKVSKTVKCMRKFNK